MTFRRSIMILTSVLALTVASQSQAQESPTLIGNFGDWAAYKFTENGKPVCYMVSQPKKAEGKYSKRGDIFALVTHRPADNAKNVFNYIAGYTYKEGSSVTVDVNNTKFSLFTQNDMAWASDQDTDNRLADAIRKGEKIVVKGSSMRGTATTDTFSLKGSGGAHDAINQACGVN